MQASTRLLTKWPRFLPNSLLYRHMNSGTYHSKQCSLGVGAIAYSHQFITSNVYLKQFSLFIALRSLLSQRCLFD
jgi:hypothetical protein